MSKHFSQQPHRPLAYASLALVSSLLLTVWLIAPGSAQTRSFTTERVVSSDFNNWKPSKAANADAPRLLSEKESLESYGQLPLAYEANWGQANEEVRFISRGSGYGLFLTSTEAVLALRQTITPDRMTREGSRLPRRPKQVREAVLRLKLVGANPMPEVMGMAELPGKVNYFIGNDPAKWRKDVPTYAMVKYQSVYSGVDMIYHGNQGQLEYDFIVSPGANPKTIAMQFTNTRGLYVNQKGDLVLKIKGGHVTLLKPDLYQEVNGAKQSIEGGYHLTGKRQVGFQVANYDTTKPLIIDPVLVYSTYLGGTGVDMPSDLAVDGAGNAYVTGSTTSNTNFPTLNPAQGNYGGGWEDAFVSKLNPAGNALIYSTYLGGTGGDSGNAIAVDSAGNAYVAGDTDSLNFPLMNPFQTITAQSAGFLTKLNAAGNALLYSTSLGGFLGWGVAVDAAGSAYVTGNAYSGNTFPLTTGAYQTTFKGGWDAFVTKFSPSGNALIYSTLLGGNQPDVIHDIAVNGAGDAYVTGFTWSSDFPVMNAPQSTPGGGRDAFVTKLNATGTGLIYSTYLGGTGDEQGWAIALDSANNAFVVGQTESGNFPVNNAFQPSFGGGTFDGFLTKVNPTGTAWVYSTYIGGTQSDHAWGVAVDAAGSAYITGETMSANFPMMLPLQGTLNGISDVFVTEFNPAGNALIFSTFFGGSLSDGGYHHGVYSGSQAIAVDGVGSIYITGKTFSVDFPTVNPYQAVFGGGNEDGFVAKISIAAPCVAPPNTTMVAWYPFDETTGFTAANLATRNTGTLFNSPTHIPGKVAAALRFDGINDLVRSPSSIVTNIGPAGIPQTCSGNYSTCRGDFSIDAWIRVHPMASLAAIPIVNKRTGSGSTTKGYLFFVIQRNKLGLQLADGLGTGFTNHLSPIISGLTAGWHHVAVTISRRSPAGIKWYHNGVVIGTSDPTTPVASQRYGSLANNGPLDIGSSLTSWFKGDIDELEIFNRELTPVEVQGIFNAGASGKCK